jgi:membrane associated rhomboid family serine protease
MFIPLKDRNPTRTFPYVTIVLIVLNIYIFVLQYLFGNEREVFNTVYRLGFVPALFRNQLHPEKYDASWQRLKEDFKRRPMQSRRLSEWFEEAQTRLQLMRDLKEIEGSRRKMEPVTLLTSIFLHGSIWHVLANMLFLWVFGNNIEDSTGHVRFLLFYIFCGAFASLAHMWVHSDSVIPTIGASGAISGVMGAYLVLFPSARVMTIVPIFYFLWYPIELPAYLYLGYWLLLQLVLGHFSLLAPGGGGVAWFAHIGGFVAGLLLIFPFKKRYVKAAWRISEE